MLEVLLQKLPLIIVGGSLLLFLVCWELVFPDREYNAKVVKRSYLTNIILLITNNILFLVTNITVLYTLAYTYQLPYQEYWYVIPEWTRLLLGILILDLVLWLWHILAHKSNLLWRFHKCHHSEQYLNATSAIRFHVAELFLSLCFKAFFLWLLAIPLWIFLVNEILITFFAAFHHSNIKISNKVQKYLEYVVITPNLHRTHHSTVREEHDSNYGVIFSCWDKIFKTIQHVRPTSIGLNNQNEKTFFNFWICPFQKK